MGSFSLLNSQNPSIDRRPRRLAVQVVDLKGRRDLRQPIHAESHGNGDRNCRDDRDLAQRSMLHLERCQELPVGLPETVEVELGSKEACVRRFVGKP